MDNRPIGVFDSGFGGLTVVSEIVKLLPREDIIYFGDTARVPYGTKSKDAVTRFSLEIAGFLVSKNIKALVVACNTASALSLGRLKRKYNIPVIGVIEPGARSALHKTKVNKIGIIGTIATINSNAYKNTINKMNKKIKVFSQSCPLFVPLIEEGWISREITRNIAKEYLRPLLKCKIDAVVLGCTHYPLLKGIIKDTCGPKVELVDSANATAHALKEVLMRSGKLKRGKTKGKYKFFVSDAPEKFSKIGKRFFKRAISKVSKINVEGK